MQGHPDKGTVMQSLCPVCFFALVWDGKVCYTGRRSDWTNEKTGGSYDIGGACSRQESSHHLRGREGALRCRFLDMGLIPRTHVEVCKVAPMGDPIEIRLRGYELTIRKEDAAKIEIMEEKS